MHQWNSQDFRDFLAQINFNLNYLSILFANHNYNGRVLSLYQYLYHLKRYLNLKYFNQLLIKLEH
jgi:hypothetical protein